MKNSKVLFTLGTQRTGFCLGVLTLACGLIGCGNASAAARRNPGAVKSKSGELVQGFRSDLVVIEGKSGNGSGFIASIKGRKFLVSNAHVLAGIRGPRLKLLDNSPLKLGAASVAVGHDIVIFAVIEGGTGIPTVNSTPTETTIGDAVVVTGNAGGMDVVTALQGELVGIGPDRVEVSAAIELGSSGSPIIHMDSGKVIGVATYLTADPPSSDRRLAFSRFGNVRRFGYRLDSVQTWQAIDWRRFYAEADRIDQIKKTTAELCEAAQERVLRFRHPTSGYEVPAIRQAMEKYATTVKQYPERAEQAAVNLLASLRVASQADIMAARGTFTYDFFRREFETEEHTREELAKALGKAL